jgi:hypothetical protein
MPFNYTTYVAYRNQTHSDRVIFWCLPTLLRIKPYYEFEIPKQGSGNLSLGRYSPLFSQR